MNKIEKLELKYLCGYLPHGLKWTLQELNTFTMSGITNETLYTKEGSVLTWPKHPDLPVCLFPLLLPISALDTQILINDLHGKISDAIFDWIDYFNSDSANKDNAILCAPYPVIEWCFENHIDIYGLIDAVLAIDKRTVKL